MNYKIKYIKSLNNISAQFRDEMDAEDHSNLNSVIGRLFCEIDDDGNMTVELAKELGMEFMYKEVK